MGLTLTRVELTRRLLSPSRNPSLLSGASSSMVAMGVPSLADEDLEENMPTMRPTMPPPAPALGVPLSLLLPPTEDRRPASLPCAELSMDPAPDLELLLSPPLPLATEARRPFSWSLPWEPCEDPPPKAPNPTRECSEQSSPIRGLSNCGGTGTSPATRRRTRGASGRSCR